MKNELASYLNVTLGEGCPRGRAVLPPYPCDWIYFGGGRESDFECSPGSLAPSRMASN